MSLEQRVEPLPESMADTQPINSIEIAFGIPVWLSDEHQGILHRLLDDITRAPWNEPKEGVHWPAGTGGRPSWSQADARMLGKPVDPDAPESGEPTFDMSILAFECCAREFVSEEERRRVEARRVKPKKAAPPLPYRTWLDAAVDSFPNTNLSIPEHVSAAQAEAGARADLERLRLERTHGHEARDFLRRASGGEYRIVSSGDLTELQIAEARSKGLFWVDPGNSLGWALLPWSLTTAKDDARATLTPGGKHE